MIVVDPGPLSPEERTALDFFNFMIEERANALEPNEWIEALLPPEATPKVATQVKAGWEARGYGAGVFFAEGNRYRIVLSPPRSTVSLPPLRQAAAKSAPLAKGSRRILIRMPTRGRPAQALAALAAYREMAGIPVAIEVVADANDEAMLAADVVERLVSLGCTLTIGNHRNKVEAVNGGKVSDWDILVVASDDMVPVKHGYANRIVEAMDARFPHLDGAIFFDDGYAHADCCTLPIFGRRLYEQFGYVYEPSYKSLWCDKEQTELLRAMGRLVFVGEKIIEHRHPSTGSTPNDSLYEKNTEAASGDHENYERRKDLRRPRGQIGFDAPPIALSLLIATIPSRKERLSRLLEHIYGQIIRDRPREVEVLVDAAEGEIGAKRQRLLGRAKGHYVAYVDDDDWVAHDYISRVVGAIEASDYNVDCLSLYGQMTSDGNPSGRFHHSIQYGEWKVKSEAGLYYRTPNHLNAVRRDLALKAGFPVELSHGEDHEYSKRLKSLLRTEADPGKAPLYFYWFSTADKAARAAR